MNKTILVIGDVTRDQYQPIRLELLRESATPKIVRVTPQELLLDDEETLVGMYGSPSEVRMYCEYQNDSDDVDLDDVSIMEADALKQSDMYDRIITEHLAQYGNIVTVVMTQDIYDHWFITPRHVAGYLDERYNRWVVNPRTARAELIG